MSMPRRMAMTKVSHDMMMNVPAVSPFFDTVLASNRLGDQNDESRQEKVLDFHL